MSSVSGGYTMMDLTNGMNPYEQQQFDQNIQNSFSSTLNQMKQEQKEGQDAIKQSIEENS